MKIEIENNVEDLKVVMTATLPFREKMNQERKVVKKQELRELFLKNFKKPKGHILGACTTQGSRLDNNYRDRCTSRWVFSLVPEKNKTIRTTKRTKSDKTVTATKTGRISRKTSTRKK